MFSLTVVEAPEWFKPAILIFIHKQKHNKELSCQCSGNSARLTSAVTPIDGSPMPLIKVLSTTDLSNSLTPTGVKTVPSTLKGASENKCVSRPPEQPGLNNKAVLDSVTLIKMVTNIWGPPQARSHYRHLHNAQEHLQESVDINLGTTFLINTHIPRSLESREFFFLQCRRGTSFLRVLVANWLWRNLMWKWQTHLFLSWLTVAGHVLDSRCLNFPSS